MIFLAQQKLSMILTDESAENFFHEICFYEHCWLLRGSVTKLYYQLMLSGICYLDEIAS